MSLEGIMRLNLLTSLLCFILLAITSLAFWRFGWPLIQPKTGQLAVATPFQSSEVYFDGKALGQTPFYSKNLPIGDHQIKIVSGQSQWELKTTLTESTFNTLELNLSNSEKFISGDNLFFKVGERSLLVLSKPKEAKVFLNQKEVGQTPLKLEPQNGVSQITLRKDGYLPRELTLNIMEGYRLTASVFLSADPFGEVKKIDATSKANLFSLYNSHLDLGQSFADWVEGIKFTQNQFTGAETRFDAIIDPDGKNYILNQTEWANKQATKSLTNIGYLLTKKDAGLSEKAKSEWEKIKLQFN